MRGEKREYRELESERECQVRGGIEERMRGEKKLTFFSFTYMLHNFKILS